MDSRNAVAGRVAADFARLYHPDTIRVRSRTFFEGVYSPSCESVYTFMSGHEEPAAEVSERFIPFHVMC